MKYGYARVSTTGQKMDRQLEKLYQFGITDQQIFADYQSGKNFEREMYQKLKRKLKAGDLLVIKSIDRLGRNYQAILKEWSEITIEIEADILVLDMPLLDTRTHPDSLVNRLVSDLVLQILSFVAENERDSIRQRQAEGIFIAKSKGQHMGRPRYLLPDNFTEIETAYNKKEITLEIALHQLNMKKGTFYKYRRQQIVV